jgi:hypothetical protein
MERTPEEIINQEIAMQEAEARLLRFCAEKFPAFARLLNDKAKQADIAAHNARVFLQGREILSGVQ